MNADNVLVNTPPPPPRRDTASATPDAPNSMASRLTVLSAWVLVVFYSMILGTVAVFVAKLFIDQRWMDHAISAMWLCIAGAAIALVVLRIIDAVRARSGNPPA